MGTKEKTRGEALEVLLKECDPGTARAAVIGLYAKQQQMTLSGLAKSRNISEMLDAPSPGAVEGIYGRLAPQLGRLTLKDVERVFESLIDAHRRKRQGVVYTPDFIIDCLIETAVGMRAEKGAPPRFCDPACGSGGFLLRAAGLLSKAFGIGVAGAVRNFIRGVDNDPRAVMHAKCLMGLYLATHDADPSIADEVVICDDTLLSPPGQLWNALRYGDGVDLLATNPPYVKLQTLELSYRQQLLDRFPEYATGSFSLALLFLIGGHRLLSHDGVLAYITQNNLFTSLAGESVRQYLQSARCLRRIVDFGHQHIFANASAYTCLVFMDSRETDALQYARVKGQATASAIGQLSFSSIPTRSLKARKWRLASCSDLENLRKIENMGLPLGHVARVRVGFATLKDAVFFLRGRMGGENGGFVTADGRALETGATRPAVKIADMDSEADLAFNECRVIFPYVKRQGRWHLMEEVDLAARFPETYAYLCERRALLEGRDKGKGGYPAWYAWGRTQGREATGPKLLTKAFSSRPNFMLDESDQLFCNGYAVSRAEIRLPMPSMSLRAMQNILNSRIMHYYTILTSIQLGGNYQCYQKNFIEKFGIPLLDGQTAATVETLQGDKLNQFLADLYGINAAEMQEVVGGD